MSISPPVCRVRDIKPVFTPWFSAMHPESDEGAVFLGHLLVITVVDGKVEIEAQDLYVTQKWEYLRRTGDEEAQYGTLGFTPPGSIYEFIAKLVREDFLVNRTKFVPCAWTSG